MKKLLLLMAFLFGLIISFSAIKLIVENHSGDLISSIGLAAILVLFSFYPFNFLLPINHKQGMASFLEKVLQWPFWGRKSEIPVNLGPWWLNRLKNAILLVTFAPFLFILFTMWRAKFLRGIF